MEGPSYKENFKGKRKAMAFSEFDVSAEHCLHLQNKVWLKQQLANGKIGQELLGFDDQTVVKFYQAAYRLFQKHDYEKAAQAFLFMIILNPYQYDYWLGLGAATQRKGDHEGAIDAYEMAAICNLDCPIAYFHLAQCLFAMHDRISALEALELAIQYSENSTEYEDLYHQALAAKETLLHES